MKDPCLDSTDAKKSSPGGLLPSVAFSEAELESTPDREITSEPLPSIIETSPAPSSDQQHQRSSVLSEEPSPQIKVPAPPPTTSGSKQSRHHHLASEVDFNIDAMTEAGSSSSHASLTPKLGKRRTRLLSHDSTQQVSTAANSSNAKSSKTKSLPEIPAAIDHDDDEQYANRIRLGVCAMDKKARSKPMAEILSRLDDKLFQVVFYGDSVILEQPIEEWPVVDALIAFFSKGYPLEKAKAYVRLRKPFVLNDLETQKLLQDRRKVYDLLLASGIDVPRHVYLSRDDYVSTGVGDGNGNRDQEPQEFDDHIVVNGVTIHKPFVEKPVDAEDHNIAIYYPTSAGGGCKKLFRKIGNRSSEFYSDIHEVRRDGGSYIYEEFVETQGTDVKMYTVGPEYGHAEARKSPTVDGKVERNSDGKEVRFPVILTFREKEIARRIVLVFKQFVCGFDILRVQEGHSVVSYVCDVNGWSFVKNSRKYYDDCAQIVSEHILAALRPSKLKRFSTLAPLVTSREDVLEGGEVTKTKDSFLSRATRILQGHPESHSHVDDDAMSAGASVDNSLAGSTHNTASSAVEHGSGEGTAAAATLVEGALPVREFPETLTSEPASMAPSANSSVDNGEEVTSPRRRSGSILSSHTEELRCVIAIIRHGDRTPKQKLKVNMTEPHILEYFHKYIENCHEDLKVKGKAPLTEFLLTVKSTLQDLEKTKENHNIRHQLMHMRDILERWKIVGLNRKLQIKPKSFETYIDEDGIEKERCVKIQLILKWGGNLTKLGEKQSINLGRRFRSEMYPDAPGGGILRLHSTFRHDLKIKTSDEGRVMKTAAAFAKGLLELEGDLPPILVSLVHKERGSMHMLDPSGNKEAKLELDECKEKITQNLQRDIDVDSAKEEDLEQLAGPKDLLSLRKALREVGNPRRTLAKIHDTIGELLVQLEEMLEELGSGDEQRIEGGEGLEGKDEGEFALSGVKLYKGETLLELTERWRFIYDRLFDCETDTYDLSRVPDVHDNVRFDLLHNTRLGLSDTLKQLYKLIKPLADCVVPQEYGTTIPEKRSVGLKICNGLLEKIKYDLSVARTDNQVDMRYMINMDYSADLPINTMGRRIRTRLYFTSESHLHTVLNSFRFAVADHPLLSFKGIEIINSTPELCYLTQIVMRVFEDTRFELSDSRRYRVEILFSPGATAEPLSIPEEDRDLDLTRTGTEPLQQIGRDGLTCQEVEDFFQMAIMEGGGLQNVEELASFPPSPESKQIQGSPAKVAPKQYELEPTIEENDGPERLEEADQDRSLQSKELFSAEADAHKSEDGGGGARASRKYFWGTIAVSSVLAGVGCVLVACSIAGRDRRRWSTRRY